MTVVTFECGDDPSIGPVDGVTVIDNLCSRPTQLVERIGGADRVVLLLHEDAFDLAHIQKALRGADVDPLGAQVLAVPARRSEPELETVVTGLRRRAQAFEGSKPENAKPVLTGEVTRRGFLKPPLPAYLAVPTVDSEVCAAENGCRACVDVCPQTAYISNRGRIRFNKDICEPCGRCVSACPTEAIENPAATPAMLADQITGLIAEAGEAIGIRFVCGRARQVEPVAHWYDVVVPCTGMVPGTWLITTLLMGAGSVSATVCSSVGCPVELDGSTLDAIDFARGLLKEAGMSGESVTLAPSVVDVRVADLAFSRPFTHSGNLETYAALASLAGKAIVHSHRASSTAAVAIDTDACTLCTQCAQTCPTNAITTTYDHEAIQLVFDASRCTHCRQCTLVCPELDQGAIEVTGLVDTDLLTAGSRIAAKGTVLHCESCGKPVAPSSMMDRISALLGDGFDDTVTYLARRCTDCRGLR